jgi:hypothetical protein
LSDIAHLLCELIQMTTPALARIIIVNALGLVRIQCCHGSARLRSLGQHGVVGRTFRRDGFAVAPATRNLLGRA